MRWGRGHRQVQACDDTSRIFCTMASFLGLYFFQVRTGPHSCFERIEDGCLGSSNLKKRERTGMARAVPIRNEKNRAWLNVTGQKWKAKIVDQAVQSPWPWVSQGIEGAMWHAVVRLEIILFVFLGWRPSSAPPDHSAFHFIVVWAWKLLKTEGGPASEIYSLGFFEHICWNRRFSGEQVSSRKILRRVLPKELRRFQFVPLCKGASVQRLLCVKKAFVCKSFCV